MIVVDTYLLVYAGNLTSDAHIAVLAIEHGAPVYSADHDVKRFRGVDHMNPLA